VTEPEQPQGVARDDRASRTADADPVAAGPVPEASRARHGNALRAGVLGSTDGLVSNLSLVMGVAGSGAPHEAIVVAGLAGLVAGSLSMALGEYLSVQSARELFATELRIEAGQLARMAVTLMDGGDIDPLAPRLVDQVLAASDALPRHRVVRADGTMPWGQPQRELPLAEGVPMCGERVDLSEARVPREAELPG
jgi:alkylated DNA nucleotide flippase Atl1